MSSDINVQTFSGKVNINNNLLVGSSHFYVDTVGNKVGITTASPDAGLHVNSNAFVNTDFRVGTSIVMNDTAGQITAGSFVGDGSAMTGINSDSGSWVNGTGNVYLSTTTDKVGIGTSDPDNQLHLLDTSTDQTTGLFIEKQNGGSGTAQITFGVNAPTENPGVAKAGLFFERTHANGRGDLHICVDGVDDANGVGIGDAVMTINKDGNIGIGTTSPGEKLHVSGNIGVGWGNGRRIIMDFDDSYRQGLVLDAATRTMTLFSTTNDSGGAIAFNTRGGSGSSDTDYGTERMRINSSGNVGIGTTSPNSKLEVLGTTSSHNSTIYPLTVSTVSSSSTEVQEGIGTGIEFRVERRHTDNIQNDCGAIRVYGASGIPSTEDRWNMAFRVRDNDTFREPMTIQYNRNVGINTTSPQKLLHIKQSTNGSSNGVAGDAIRIEQSGTSSPEYWNIGVDPDTSNADLIFNHNGSSIAGYVQFLGGNSSRSTIANGNITSNFTGQHRTFIKTIPFTKTNLFEGLIVCADNNKYIKMSGGIEIGSNAITINESLPVVSLCKTIKDKKIFGVISMSEDPEKRVEGVGNILCTLPKELGDTRVYINSLGEGAIWVININGPLESGDYITSSIVPGYGMKQDDGILYNYTVAKITMDCDFNPTTQPIQNINKEMGEVNYWVKTIYENVTEEEYSNLTDENRRIVDGIYQKITKEESKTEQEGYELEVRQELVNVLDEHGQLQWEDTEETEKAYKVRYLLPDGTQISEDEYTTRALADEKVYIAAFVGCTYHCG